MSRSAPDAVVLEGARAQAYCALATRLIEVSRPGGHFVDPAAMRHLLWGLSRPLPRQAEPRVEVLAATGLPSLRSLEPLAALRATAVEFFEAHKKKPLPDARAFLTALAGAALPPTSSTVGRLVSRARGGRRFQVVHERYAGQLGLPVRFTFHLTDEKQRYLTANKEGQATVSRALEKALALSCDGGAEEALWGLAALDGAEVAEVVMGQLGPLETGAFPGPLSAFLSAEVPSLWPRAPSPEPRAFENAVLHQVIERAASDVAADGCRDPFGAVPRDEQVERRRAALKYRVFRERRLACTEALHAPLEKHLQSLGQPLVLRSR